MWWDTYIEGLHTVVLFDEVRARTLLQLGDILTWTDGRSVPVEVKGSTRDLHADTFIFTSESPIEEWWPGADLRSLRRRVEEGGGLYVVWQERPGRLHGRVGRVTIVNDPVFEPMTQWGTGELPSFADPPSSNVPIPEKGTIHQRC